MRAVMTGFITRCCASVWISRLLLAWALACGLGAVARAEGAALSALSVAREGNELILSARLDFALSPVVEDALHKGIPVHFVAEAEVLRPLVQGDGLLQLMQKNLPAERVQALLTKLETRRAAPVATAPDAAPAAASTATD